MMYVRVCAYVGQTLFCPMRGLPAGTEDVPPPPLENGDSRTTERAREGHKYPKMDAAKAYTVIPYQLSDEACARAPSPI